ncbi:MAG: hypothetical protein WCL16_12485 [bacterium]
MAANAVAVEQRWADELFDAHLDWFPEGEQHTMCGHFKLAYYAIAFQPE